MSAMLMQLTSAGFVLFAGVTGIDRNTGIAHCTAIRRRSPPVCSTFGTGNCTDYFATLDNSGMQLFQLLTAANFPQIAIPAYECNPLSMLFFVAFIAIGIYLFLSLTLAVTYSTFKNLMAAEVVHKYDRMFSGFDMAFQELINPSTETMRPDSFRSPASSNRTVSNPMAAANAVSMELPTIGASVIATPSPNPERLSKKDFITFFGVLRPDVNEKCAALFFDVFDVNNQEIVSSRTSKCFLFLHEAEVMCVILLADLFRRISKVVSQLWQADRPRCQTCCKSTWFEEQ
jgi:hypothetical protein